MGNIQSKFCKEEGVEGQEKYEDWTLLHDWIMETRKINKLSISSFLFSCDFDPEESYYRDLVSSKLSMPSKRADTKGSIMRKKIAEFMLSGNFIALRSDRDCQFEFAISDWRTDNIIYLHSHFIASLSVCKKLTLNIHKEFNKHTLPDSVLLDKIWEDNTISSHFQKENIKVSTKFCIY
jgi:hypothetical protein